jgi:hypothetical protein
LRDERGVPNNNTYKSSEDFLKQMDPGTFDGDPRSEIPKLSRAQLEEVVGILLERDTRPQRNFTVVKDCLPGTRFELKECTVASEIVGGVRRAVTIPAGAILKVESGASDGERTIDVQWAAGRSRSLQNICMLAELRSGRKAPNAHH